MVWDLFLLMCLLACVHAFPGKHTHRSSARKCNGAEDFCELAVYQYSFGGTHNSGAFGLSTPETLDISLFGANLNFLGSDQLVGCYFDNHKSNYEQQLALGVRFFSPDFCEFVSEGESVVKDCHAMNAETIAWGTTLSNTMDTIFDWLNANRDEIVMFRPENLRGVRLGNIETQIGASSGACFDADADLQSLQTLNLEKARCLRLGRDTNISRFPEQKKLGFLIEINVRFVLVETKGCHNRSWAATVKSSEEVGKFMDAQQAFVDSLENVKHSASTRDASLQNMMFLVELDVYRTADPSKGSFGCNFDSAKELNELIFPSNDDSRDYDAPEGFVCEGLVCAGYRSKLELINFDILSKGHTLGAVVLDSPSHGHLKDTMFRINMATYRHIKGLPEPGLEWYELSWLVISSVSLVAISCLAVLGWRWRRTRSLKRMRKKDEKIEKMYASVYAQAGIRSPAQDRQVLAANQYTTGYGQTPFTGMYGQPQRQSQFQAASNFPPQQNSPVGFHSRNSAPSFYGQHSPVGLYGQHLSPRAQLLGHRSPVGFFGQNAPVGFQGGPHSPVGQLPPIPGSTAWSFAHAKRVAESGNNISDDFGVSRQANFGISRQRSRIHTG